MARIYGLNGFIQGKQGNNVFSVSNGVQVVKAYQPQVSNPRTAGQREQRSKFALAGKMSGCTPSGALVGLVGANPRARRSRFVSLLVNAAAVAASGTDLVASVPFESIVFSEGSLPMFSLPITVSAQFVGTEARTTVTVSVPALSVGQVGAEYPQGYGELVVVGLFDAATSRLDELQFAQRSTSAANVFRFRLGTRRDVRVATYVVPFAPITGVSAQNAGNLYDTETAVNLVNTISRSVSSYRFGESVLMSVVPVLGATTSMAPSPNDDMRGTVEEALMDTAVTETKRKK